MGVCYTAFFVFGDIPYTVSGDIYGLVVLGAVGLSAVVGILSIVYGILSILAYRHYKFVRKMSLRAQNELKKAKKPPVNKLM